MKPVHSLVVAGLSGGSGKSVVSVGLTAALRRQGQGVAVFKKGPDYIDAGWLSRAAGCPCYNLDPYLMDCGIMIDTFRTHLAGHDFAVVEGNRGIFDGVNVEGAYSTAELARLLGVPALLVINCSKTTRTIAAQVLGCRTFDPQLRLAGVILNQIATPRHERIILEAVEHYTDVPVLGIMPRLTRDIFPMRHLGVIPPQEYGEVEEAVTRLQTLAEKNMDLDRLIPRMQPVEPLLPQAASTAKADVTIGVLRDAAFQFYYEENLEALTRAGARLVMIDALKEKALPAGLNGLYIGGGFPETSAQQLADNVSFRKSIREQVDAGLPVYAECGGLIFLGRSIILEGKEYPLADVFPVTFDLSTKPQAHGYSTAVVEGANSFYPVGTRIKGHEFRYSRVRSWEGDTRDLVMRMERGTGFADHRDGLVRNNTLALYTHVMASGTPLWVEGFMRAARKNALAQQPCTA